MFNTADVQASETVSQSAKTTDLEDKFYRQALYFYFAGDYGSALRQISLNRQRQGVDSDRSQLFEAGLQVAIGLHDQATQTLTRFEQRQANAATHNSKAKSATSPQELLLIALLQLTEQQIDQGDVETAKLTLGRITTVLPAYVEQYHVLSQLAYWPDTPPLTAQVQQKANTEENTLPTNSSAAYIALNQALLHMDQQQYNAAHPILIELKEQQWQAPEVNFWQKLFNPFAQPDIFDANDELKPEVQDALLQQQAINDYAKLLLAQLYVANQQYDLAYNELSDFPQQSPYAESALFLFAYSAQQQQQYDMSFKLLALLQQQYPYSNLAWQAALLSANQVSEQQSLAQGLTLYQQAEQLYLQKIAEIKQFGETFNDSKNIMDFATKAEDEQNTLLTPKSDVLALILTQRFNTDAPWLKKALQDPLLTNDYQTLLSLELLSDNVNTQQANSQWLKDTLTLNRQRQAKVIEQQKQLAYRDMLLSLTAQKQRIAEVIAQAEVEQNAQVFADPNQQQWLTRIDASQTTLNTLAKQRNIDDEQQRLDRIKGVLQWQLQGSFPQRLWQHKQSLKQLTEQLELLELQASRFSDLSTNKRLLSDFDVRQQQTQTDINKMTFNIEALNLKTSREIRGKISIFTQQQQYTLQQLLLTTRHQMANVLEQMSQADRAPINPSPAVDTASQGSH
ncbi:tetratricopeptide repeat protein [Shewanella sp. MF05960]|uniref:tetratricopeptide repeat protein n=1 Tax=Shewanella sp. MF05960 TaxID=3434874 RepID=UPI003D7C0D6C